jgi:putative transposase
LYGDVGRAPGGHRADPASRRSSASWCYVSPARIRVEATSGSSASSRASVSEFSATTVAKILREGGVSPAGGRAELSWREFLPAHAASMIACDFFTVETLCLGRLYVLFFIEFGTRRVHLAGCTPNPAGVWTAKQARRLAWLFPERPRPIRFLIHDRDSKFSKAFDDVCSEGVEIIRTPFRAPNANAFAERWVGTIRRDCLDWLLIVEP